MTAHASTPTNTTASAQSGASPASAAVERITVGELVVRFLERCGTRAAFGVISIHNMPMLDAMHRRRQAAGAIRFVSARGEAGACNMADAYARVSDALGVCITSTGTGAGNAAGALVEAMTAGTPLLHLTGQIDSPYLDRDLGFIHEHPAQLAMMQAVGKAALRIRDGATALGTLHEAARLARTPPCGPVSVEIPIDVQASLVDLPAELQDGPGPAAAAQPSGFAAPAPLQAADAAIDALATRLLQAKRPLLWLGGGARGAGEAVRQLMALGFGVVTSVQGRGIVPEDSLGCLGSYNLQKPAEALYAQCDAMLVVGSRLRSNETLKYQLKLPRTLLRIDANALAQGRAYPSALFVQGDAQLCLTALHRRLVDRMHIDPAWQSQVSAARLAAAQGVNATLGPYVALQDALQKQAQSRLWWVRDITLSNSMWGNRAPVLDHPRAGVHALGGGIGQGLAMGIGTAVADALHHTPHGQGRRTVVLAGDGGFMLNLGELACAAQEKAALLVLLMNDSQYGVIRNIQDDVYGGRHAYVDLHTPDFAQLCASMGVKHARIDHADQCAPVLARLWPAEGPVVVEVDMRRFGAFAAKFAGPILKKD